MEMRRKRLVLALLVGLTPGLGKAQEARPPGLPRPDGGGSQLVIGGPIAPVPLVSQARPVAAPVGEPRPPTGLTLAELEQMAERGNPTLAQAAARVEAARGQCLQVGLYPNPVAGYLGSEIGNEGRAGQQGGFLGQEIVTAGKLQLNRAVATQEIRQAECAWSAQRLRVLTDVRRGFYDVLVAQRSVELAEQLVGTGERGVKAAEELLKAKEVARADVLQARIETDSARILLDRARNRHVAAWRGLAAVVGNPALRPTPLAGSLLDNTAQFTWDASLSRLLAESPQLASAQAGVCRAQAALSRECAGRTPNVDLQANVQYDNATRDTFAGLQIGIPVPIHNRNQGNIAKAQAELIAAQQEVMRVRLALEQRLATVFEQYATAHGQVEKYTRDMLPNAEESLRLLSAGYRQGEFGYLALLTAQRTYFQTQIAYLDALRDLRVATAILEGSLLADSLQGSDSPSGGSGER
jgi:outer membrane protein, heavy metal efflux system